MKTEVIENYITMNKNLNAIDFIKAIKRISYDFEGHKNPVQRPIKGKEKIFPTWRYFDFSFHDLSVGNQHWVGQGIGEAGNSKKDNQI